jgi:hypothetical protein
MKQWGGEGRRCVRCGREDVDEDRFDCSGEEVYQLSMEPDPITMVRHYGWGQTNKFLP